MKLRYILNFFLLILVLIGASMFIYDKFLDIRYKTERKELKLENNQVISIDEKNRLLIFLDWRNRRVYSVSFDKCLTIEKMIEELKK